jgi:putative FmdB family regulatory protein
MGFIELRCRKCGHDFKRLSETGDADRRNRCPKCQAADAVVMPSSEPLFGGIAGFSRLSKDTN